MQVGRCETMRLSVRLRTMPIRPLCQPVTQSTTIPAILQQVISASPEHNQFCTYYTFFAEALVFSVDHFQLHISNNVYKIFKLYHEIHI
jgi:hypothetical protein